MSLPKTYKAFIGHGFGKEPQLEEVSLQKPGKNQVLVKIAFAPINPSDVLSSLGVYKLPIKPPHPIGLEGSGTIVALGEDLKVPHQIGDKVHVSGLGTIGQYLLTDSELCRKIKGDLSLEEAASHFVNPWTVVAMGRLLRKGDHKAAIHTAGSSALGKMLIRYFKHIGVKTINIVRRDDVVEELKKEGADYVLNSQAPDFQEQLKQIAYREGATIAFDAVGGDLTAKVIHSQPENSICYLYGQLADGKISGVDIGKVIFEKKTITGFWLTYFIEDIKGTEKLEELQNESASLLPTVLNSHIQKVFKLDDVKDALDLVKRNPAQGKVLIQPNELID